MAYLGSRDRGWKTFRVEDIPPFDGPVATFEVDRRRSGWVFVRRIDFELPGEVRAFRGEAPPAAEAAEGA